MEKEGPQVQGTAGSKSRNPEKMQMVSENYKEFSTAAAEGVKVEGDKAREKQNHATKAVSAAL